MDFPINLDRGSFVMGLEEFRQTFQLILENQLGSFMQSRKLGNHVALHSSDKDLIQLNLEETVAQIPGLEVRHININLPEVQLSVSYRDELANFTFSVE